MQNVLKSVSLNLLESAGPVQAYNGVALPLPFTQTATQLEDSSELVISSSQDPYLHNTQTYALDSKGTGIGIGTPQEISCRH
jgi:hypothetical protein